MNLAHRAIRAAQWIHAYVVLSEFCRTRWLQMGLPAAKLNVKPNFVASVGAPRQVSQRHALFVGRLGSEKGIIELLNAWVLLPQIPLRVIGDGPLMAQCGEIVRGKQASHIRLLGQLDSSEVFEEMSRASFLVFPSRWDEPCPMTLIEAAACGLPVVASRLGGIPEIVLHQRTGLLFDPFDSSDLRAQVNWAWCQPDELELMGNSARAHFERAFSPEKNYATLSAIYDGALRNTAQTDDALLETQALASLSKQS